MAKITFFISNFDYAYELKRIYSFRLPESRSAGQKNVIIAFGLKKRNVPITALQKYTL